MYFRAILIRVLETTYTGHEAIIVPPTCLDRSSDPGNVVGLATMVSKTRRLPGGTAIAPDPTEINALMWAVAERQDIEACEVLYNYYVPKVRAYMSKIGSDRALADEMARETMLTVWRKAQLFDPGKGQASTWIYTIARNIRMNWRAAELQSGHKIN